MRAKTGYLWMVVVIGLAVQAIGAPSYLRAGTSILEVVPKGVHITESFRGALVTVSADIPKGASTVLEIKGPVHDDHLLRQGRKGGLWMSVGEVTVHGAPSVYLVMSSPDLPSNSSTGPQWGYGVLQKGMQFAGAIPKEGAGELFQQFVKLKESEGLYGVFPKSLKVVGSSDDRSTVEGQLVLPSNIAPGKYNILLSVLNSGKLLERTSFELPIDMTGLPGILASLAYRHAVLYGLIAVIIAIVTGFVMGFLFKGKAAH